MIHIYGIKNCDTMKKTFIWCTEHGVDYTFHDYKKSGVPRDRLVAWCQAMGWKTLLNTKGRTYLTLPPERRNISTQSAAVALMLEYPSAIKRPLIETDQGQLIAGFDPQVLQSFALADSKTA